MDLCFPYVNLNMKIERYIICKICDGWVYLRGSEPIGKSVGKSRIITNYMVCPLLGTRIRRKLAISCFIHNILFFPFPK